MNLPSHYNATPLSELTAPDQPERTHRPRYHLALQPVKDGNRINHVIGVTGNSERSVGGHGYMVGQRGGGQRKARGGGEGGVW